MNLYKSIVILYLDVFIGQWYNNNGIKYAIIKLGDIATSKMFLILPDQFPLITILMLIRNSNT